MNKENGYRSGFDGNRYASKGNPAGGKFSPGRSLYTDERYGDRELYLEDQGLRQDSDIWDPRELGVEHPNGLELVGDDVNLGSYYGKGPKGYTRSDQRILEDVCQRLQDNDQVDASDIEVNVDNGLVVLKGSVEGRRMKKLAERCIEDIRGVEDIRNELRAS